MLSAPPSVADLLSVDSDALQLNSVTRLLLVGAILLVCLLRVRDTLEAFRSSMISIAGCLFGSGNDETGLPGPRGLPFLGYMPFLGKDPHKTLADLSNCYGDMFRLRAGCREFVVVSSVKKVLQMAKRFPEELYGKPRTFTTQKLTVGAHNDMLHRWKKRRAYTNAGLKYLERYSTTDIVQEEVRNMIEYVESISGSGKPGRDVRHEISYFVSCVMHRMAYGGRPGDAARDSLRRMVHTMPDYTTTIGSFSPFDLVPFLRHVFKDRFRKFVDFNQFMNQFCRQEKVRCLNETNDDVASSSSSSADPPADLLNFFKRKWERMSETDRAKFSLTDDVLYDGLEDIIRAGTESSSLLIQWFLLYVTVFPGVQTRMAEEIDEYLSSRRNREDLEVEDLSSLPYCQAVLAETYRFCCLNPFLKRELTADIEVDGVRLRKGSVILINNWSINNDPDHWSSPDEFRPERFLLSDGSLDREKTENFIPFGFGKRKCIGIYTGRSLCALAAVSLVQNFEMSLDEGSKPDLSATFGIGLSPKEYRVQFKKR